MTTLFPPYEEITAKDAQSERMGAGRIVDYLQDVLIEIDAEGCIRGFNASAVALFGHSFVALEGKSIQQLFPDYQFPRGDHASALGQNLYQEFQHKGRLSLQGVATDGARLQIKLLMIEKTAEGFVLLLVNQLVNLKPQADSFVQQEIVQALQDGIADAVIVVDAKGKIASINPIGRELLGVSGLLGKGVLVDELLMLFDAETKAPLPSLYRSVMEQGSTVSIAKGAALYVADAKPLSITGQATPVRDRLGNVQGCVLVFHDTSVEGRASTHLSWQANHDRLTQLPNRTYFEAELERAVELAKCGDVTHGLIYFDLYQFKVINDTCGHAGGDELLRRLAKVFGRVLRSQDLLARLGSDEFGILLRSCTLSGTQRVADSLLREVQDFSMAWEGHALKVGISVGAVVIDKDTESKAQVLGAAEMSCSTAKESGRNRIHIYHNRNMQEVERRREEMNWVAKINEALAENRFVLYQQPIVPIVKAHDHAAPENQVKEAHYEILVRMLGRDGEIIPPGYFIPAAERYGLMDDIDRWVLTNLLDYQRARMDKGLVIESYAVNLSGPSLGDASFCDFVLAEFARTGIEPSLLQFEITETAAIGNIERAMKFMEIFRARGCKFYLDDFGSGLSSFSYLKDLPVDYLKIDGAFVKGMDGDSIDYAMVSAINHLAHVMGIGTVAEYVENDTLLEQLREIGVDYAQGYGIAAPAPLV